VSACEFPSSAEEGWPRHQKENGAATFDGADGVVLVKRMHDFLTNTTPSARLWSLRGILTSRSHPSSAEEGSRAHLNLLLIWTASHQNGVVWSKDAFSDQTPRLRGCGRFAAFLLRSNSESIIVRITIAEINLHNLSDANQCNEVFAVDSKLVLNADNGVVRYNVVPVTPYDKRYPPNEIDYSSYIDNPDQTVFFARFEDELAGELVCGNGGTTLLISKTSR
jgi:hypothetical protein